ncbi:helix-turn-helix transcriptional regulator [Paenibacillus sp. GSMTC-2017]|nr:helix-turn-helix transcriptional regulator [Paenibacillus sp. GSMTC-2017]
MNNLFSQLDQTIDETVSLSQSIEEDHEHSVREAIRQMIHRLDDSTLSSEELANAASYSPFHFDRIFRSVTGIPPRLFLSALRFQWSKRLLLKSSSTATEVGQTVGYSSFGTFSTNFARFIGLSPQQFRAFIEKKMLGLEEIQRMRIALRYNSPSNVEGYVKAPSSLDGIICVGLFPKPIPMGKPIGCTMLFGPGKYAIPNVPDGVYYVMAIAFSWDAPHDEYLHPQHALRGKAIGKLTIANGITKGVSDVTLRPPRFYDPPILISFPLLIQNFIDGIE